MTRPTSALAGAALAAMAVLGMARPSLSQGSPAPVGVWQGTTSGDTIWLKPDGNCSAIGSINVHGVCRWSATATGGVLTMTYFWVIDYANLGWSIRWLDRDRILVNEVEVFQRLE